MVFLDGMEAPVTGGRLVPVSIEMQDLDLGGPRREAQEGALPLLVELAEVETLEAGGRRCEVSAENMPLSVWDLAERVLLVLDHSAEEQPLVGVEADVEPLHEARAPVPRFRFGLIDFLLLLPRERRKGRATVDI